MTMDNSNRILAQDLKRGTAEESVALGVVRIIALGGAVESLAVKISVVTNQVDDDIIAQARLENNRLLLAVRDRDEKFFSCLAQRKAALEHGAVGRHDQAQLMALPFEGGGKGPRHIGQTAGLGKGHDLGGYHGNLHAIGLAWSCVAATSGCHLGADLNLVTTAVPHH